MWTWIFAWLSLYPHLLPWRPLVLPALSFDFKFAYWKLEMKYCSTINCLCCSSERRLLMHVGRDSVPSLRFGCSKPNKPRIAGMLVLICRCLEYIDSKTRTERTQAKAVVWLNKASINIPCIDKGNLSVADDRSKTKEIISLRQTSKRCSLIECSITWQHSSNLHAPIVSRSKQSLLKRVWYRKHANLTCSLFLKGETSRAESEQTIFVRRFVQSFCDNSHRQK